MKGIQRGACRAHLRLSVAYNAVKVHDKYIRRDCSHADAIVTKSLATCYGRIMPLLIWP